MFCQAIKMSGHVLGFRQTTDDRRLCRRRDGKGRIHVECWFDVVGYSREIEVRSCTKKDEKG